MASIALWAIAVCRSSATFCLSFLIEEREVGAGSGEAAWGGGGGGGGERHRNRERERETERDRDRERDTHTHIYREREREGDLFLILFNDLVWEVEGGGGGCWSEIQAPVISRHVWRRRRTDGAFHFP